MGATDLDIEFEDDEEIRAREEAERKKSEVVEEVDLDFSVGGAEPAEEPVEEPVKKKKKKRPQPEAAAPEPAAEAEPVSVPVAEKPTAAPTPVAEAAPVVESQVVHTSAPEQAAPAPVVQTQTITEVVQIGANYQLGDELKRASAGNKVLQIEVEAKIQVAVAEHMANILADKKLFEHKVSKLIKQIAAKAPAAKKELIMLNKLLKEFTSDKKVSEESKEPRPTQVPKKKAS